MLTAKEIKETLDSEFGGRAATISEDGMLVTLETENWDRQCGDDPYAYRFEYDLKIDEIYCTPIGGNGRNWGTPYNAGKETYEKLRYACECALEHNWRNWG